MPSSPSGGGRSWNFFSLVWIVNLVASCFPTLLLSISLHSCYLPWPPAVDLLYSLLFHILSLSLLSLCCRKPLRCICHLRLPCKLSACGARDNVIRFARMYMCARASEPALVLALCAQRDRLCTLLIYVPPSVMPCRQVSQIPSVANFAIACTRKLHTRDLKISNKAQVMQIRVTIESRCRQHCSVDPCLKLP